LKEWIYVTKTTNGKIVTHRMKEDGSIEVFNRSKDQILSLLKEGDPKKKGAYKEVEIEQKTSKNGTIHLYLGFIDKRHKYVIMHPSVKGSIKLINIFDENKKQWFFETYSIGENGEKDKLTSKYKMIKSETESHNTIERCSLTPEKDAIILQLLSSNPQSPTEFNNLEWKTKTDNNGEVKITFTISNGEHKSTAIATGTTEPGPVTITRYFDNELEEWIFKTERLDKNNKPIIGHLRLIRKTNFYSFKKIKKNSLHFKRSSVQ